MKCMWSPFTVKCFVTDFILYSNTTKLSCKIIIEALPVTVVQPVLVSKKALKSSKIQNGGLHFKEEISILLRNTLSHIDKSAEIVLE